jgi:dienelactone hydrolase
MRRLAFVIALLVAAPLYAQSSWGQLEAGPYAAGFTQLERYDSSRPYRSARTLGGKPREGERARPIHVSIWYPAKASGATPLTLSDYVDMAGAESRFDLPSEEQKRRGDAAIFGLPILANTTPEQRAKMRALTSHAIRDAKPAEGKFPLILYSLGSAAVAHVTPEYLASHGYVVVQSPRLGAWAGFPQDGRDPFDLEMKLRDTDFLVNVMREWKQADLGNIGAIGFSAGGRWALAAAMKSADVHAVVSLDSVMLFNDPLGQAWQAMPHFAPDAVRVPVLHMVRTAFAKQEDAKLWTALRYADRTTMLFEDPELDHFDFQSLGYAAALAGARGAAAPKAAEMFHTFNRTTLAFLDAHLKGGPAFNPAAGKIAHLAAEPAPLRTADLLNGIEEDGADAAIAAFRRSPIPEAAMNLAGYNLLFSGRAEDGLKILAANAEAHPGSSNVYDSLADAYLATGDRAKALELAKKAAEILAKEDLPAERKAAIQGSIDQKLKQLE